MKVHRLLVGLVVAALLTGVACGGDDATTDAQQGADRSEAGGELTVWLMTGSAPDELVADLNDEFESSHDGVTVNYEVQQWDGILEKLTTALASNDPPDVIELGNTQTAQFSAAGGLLDLSDKVSDLGGDTWLEGLKESGAWDGKQFGIPFYAGNRVVFYRTDLFEDAGVAPPASFDEWIAAGEKLTAANKGNDRFQALYLPGQSWYVLLSFIWDHGGELAVQDGEAWTAAIDSPEAQAGIEDYKRLYDSLSKAPADTDEANPQQFEVFAEGNVGMMIGLPWELNSAVDANKDLEGNVAAFPIPSTNGGAAPVFLGGSNLAISAGSDQADLAYEWIKLLTGETYQTRLAEENGAIPNSTSFTSVLESDPILGVEAEAAANGKVTPVTPSWASVEATPNPLKDMLTKVLTGASVSETAGETNQMITDRMASSG